MSRSYRKFPSRYLEDLPSWPTIRMRERQCIYKEMHCVEYGDAIFPEMDKTYSWGSGHGSFDIRKRIRDGYTAEIRNILNGYTDRRNDFEDDFLEDFNHIKAERNHDDWGLNFKWLDTAAAKKAIKAWNGEPLEVLSYLNHHRIIERAVTLEQRRMVRK